MLCVMPPIMSLLMFCPFLMPRSEHSTHSTTAAIITNVCDYLLKYLRLNNNNNNNKFIDSSELYNAVYGMYTYCMCGYLRLDCVEKYTYVDIDYDVLIKRKRRKRLKVRARGRSTARTVAR